MKAEDRESAWVVGTVLLLVTRMMVYPAATVQVALDELRRLADADRDRATGTAVREVTEVLENMRRRA